MSKKRIFIIGDSTACDYSQSDYPMTGWGQALKNLINFEVINKAKAGRSSKSFVEEGLWDSVLGEIKENDYLLIQFGHNDQKIEDLNRYTSPHNEFPLYIKKYIFEALEKKAVPVLLSPIHRRIFFNGTLINTHTEYLIEIEKIVSETNVFFCDVSKETESYFNFIGEKESASLFMIYNKNEEINYPNGILDNTHLNVIGANVIAKLILNLLKEIEIIEE